MNIPKEHFSDEILNAYIDGELVPEDSARISAAMKTDDILRRRVGDLQKVSRLVQAAFEELSLPVRQPEQWTRRASAAFLWPAAATIAFVSLAGLLGWHIYGHNVDSRGIQALFVADNKVEQIPGDQVIVAEDALKLMFHVGRDDTELFDKVLNETDRLLSNYNDPDRPIVIRVIASHGGLSLFKISLTENAQRVREIKLRHDNQVDFVGCGETYNQWQIKKTEKDTDLFPEMLMVDSGVWELLRRQKQGWTLLSI